MRAGEEALGGEDGLPPRVPEGRSFGCRGADKDCSSRYRRLRPRSACHCPAVVYALLQPQQPLGSSEAWRATGRQGLLYPRGIDRPAAIMCGCPGASSEWCIRRWQTREVATLAACTTRLESRCGIWSGVHRSGGVPVQLRAVRVPRQRPDDADMSMTACLQ